MVVRARWRLFVDFRFTLLEDISVFLSWIEDSRPINLMMEGKNKKIGEKNDASPSRPQSFHQKMTSKTRQKSSILKLSPDKTGQTGPCGREMDPFWY